MIESVFAWRKENSIRDLDYSKDPDKCLTLMYFRGKDVDGGCLKRENFSNAFSFIFIFYSPLFHGGFIPYVVQTFPSLPNLYF